MVLLFGGGGGGGGGGTNALPLYRYHLNSLERCIHILSFNNFESPLFEIGMYSWSGGILRF